MMREKRGKKIVIRVSLIVVLSIGAILCFLLSIKGLLLSECKDHLMELNRKGQKMINDYNDLISDESVEQSTPFIHNVDNPKNYFDNKVETFVISKEGKVLVSFGQDYYDMISENSFGINDFLDGLDVDTYRINLMREGCKIKHYKLRENEFVYAAISATDYINGFIITIVDDQIIKSEISSIYQMAVAVVMLTVVSIILALIFYCYQQKKESRRRNKSQKPDPVTGLQQYAVHKAIAQKLVNAEKCQYAYVSFHIDKYKLIYELNSKSYCDYLLKGVAQIIANWIQEDETFAHVEDEEFGMLLVYTEELKFRQRLIGMLKHAGDIPMLENNFCNLTFHSGVCVAGKDSDINRIIAHARKARTTVGVRTIANINFYHGKGEAESEHTRRMKEVSDALAGNQFFIYLQSKYTIESEQVVGAEALVRWNHPQNGLLSPTIFLPTLEESGMILQVDMYVVRKVCEYMRKWIAIGKKVYPVSINISAKHLDDVTFLPSLLRIVDSNKIPHELIELEFPEVAVYEHQKELVALMKQLSELGFILSIDNFGAGYSAFHLLSELPIHVLKIDKSLIKDLDDSEFSDKDRTIVTHIISYAKGMNVKVVAEGVETKGQRDLLYAHQCDMIQGFYYQKPMMPEAFAQLLPSESNQTTNG